MVNKSNKIGVERIRSNPHGTLLNEGRMGIKVGDEGFERCNFRANMSHSKRPDMIVETLIQMREEKPCEERRTFLSPTPTS